MSTTPRSTRAERVRLHGGDAVQHRQFSEFEYRDVPDGTGSDVGLLTGYASVVNRPYTLVDRLGEYTETIRSGSFKDTLAANANVVLLMNHTGMPLARTGAGTLRLSEDATGLYVEARLDVENNVIAQAVRSAVQRGDASEMSFAFRVPKGGDSWSQDGSQREITRVDLEQGDVSVVAYGANSHTAGLVSVRHRDGGGRSTPIAVPPSRVNLDRAKLSLLKLGGSPRRSKPTKPLSADERARLDLDRLRKRDGK
jgi:HK97 family phage prohead protease